MAVAIPLSRVVPPTVPRVGSTRLDVRLFGRIVICVDGVPVALGGRHAQALVALLALVPRLRSRDAIATELWPDATSPTAGSLRQALWVLRSSFASAGIDAGTVLETDAEGLALHPAVTLDVDVARFERALAQDPPDVEAALCEYRGELAESLGHECFARERERLADAYEDALACAAETRLARGDWSGARAAAAALIRRDPLREEGHAVLIRVHGAEGRRSQVVRQYRRLAEVLERELDVEPLPETRAAFRAALRDAEAKSARAVDRESLAVPVTIERRSRAAAHAEPRMSL